MAQRLAHLVEDVHPAGTRLANVQPCLRTNDIDAATEQLRAVIAARPLAPFGAYAQAQRDLARLDARSRASR